jgi:RNA polymerase sigma-70 factor (ECF subfamily)
MSGEPPARGVPGVADGAPDDAGRFDRLRGALARAVARACPSWMAADRDDLVQAAMLKVMAVERGREGKEALSSSYLQRVAYSAVVDEIRVRRRRSEVPLDEGEMGELEGSRATDPEAAARGREIGRGLRGCLAAMGGDRRLALTLRLLGHSVPEAARLLDWPEKRAENLIYRGLADLRLCLAKKGLRP